MQVRSKGIPKGRIGEPDRAMMEWQMNELFKIMGQNPGNESVRQAFEGQFDTVKAADPYHFPPLVPPGHQVRVPPAGTPSGAYQFLPVSPTEPPTVQEPAWGTATPQGRPAPVQRAGPDVDRAFIGASRPNPPPGAVSGAEQPPAQGAAPGVGRSAPGANTPYRQSTNSLAAFFQRLFGQGRF